MITLFMRILPVLCPFPPAAVKVKPKVAGIVPFYLVARFKVVHAAAVVRIPAVNAVHPSAPAPAAAGRSIRNRKK